MINQLAHSRLILSISVLLTAFWLLGCATTKPANEFSGVGKVFVRSESAGGATVAGMGASALAAAKEEFTRGLLQLGYVISNEDSDPLPADVTHVFRVLVIQGAASANSNESKFLNVQLSSRVEVLRTKEICSQQTKAKEKKGRNVGSIVKITGELAFQLSQMYPRYSEVSARSTEKERHQ